MSSPAKEYNGASGKTAPDTEYASRGGGSFAADFSFRLLLLVTSLAALIVLVTGKQQERITVSAVPLLTVLRVAKFQHSPALVYLVAALAATCFYSIVTLLISATRSSRPSAKLLFHLLLLDGLMTGVLASASGAGAAVAYIGLKGNSHVRWNKICNVFDKFCRHTGSAVAVSILASAILVLLVGLSAHSLYRRSR